MDKPSSSDSSSSSESSTDKASLPLGSKSQRLDPNLEAFLKEKKDVMSRSSSSSSIPPAAASYSTPSPPKGDEEQIKAYVNRNTFLVIFDILLSSATTLLKKLSSLFTK